MPRHQLRFDSLLNIYQALVSRPLGRNQAHGPCARSDEHPNCLNRSPPISVPPHLCTTCEIHLYLLQVFNCSCRSSSSSPPLPSLLQPQNQPHQLLPCLADPLLSQIVISHLDHQRIPVQEAQKLRQGQLLPLGQYISVYNHCSTLSKALPFSQLLLSYLPRGLFHFVVSMEQGLEVECIAFV